MTEKQETLLKKYLTQDRIEKLKKKDFQVTVDFIDMIVRHRQYSSLWGEINTVPVIHLQPTHEECEGIEKYVNSHLDKFDLLNDEHAFLKEVLYVPGCEKWYKFEQTWYKGMSNSPSFRSQSIQHNKKFDGIYNALFDGGIYSCDAIENVYASALQTSIEQEIERKRKKKQKKNNKQIKKEV